MTQKKGYIPQINRKKILLISDDLRFHSGISTISREIILGLSHVYNFIQIAAMQNHPENGKAIDMSVAINQETGLTDARTILFPCDGYGSPDILKQIISVEKPDAVMIFTDPRFWIWLFQIEREIRQHTPILYYTIWDCCPNPMYNHSFYKSCDLLMCISKQTENIVKNVIGKDSFKTLDQALNDKTLDQKSLVHYVPHGVNPETFRPLDRNSPEVSNRRLEILKKDYDIVFFYNNRNITRKRTSNIILGFRTFCDNLPKEKANKCALLLHTQPVDEHGTDLVSVKDALCPHYDVIFSINKVSPQDLNVLYNCADVTVSATSNEGWGIGTTESIMAGVPTIMPVTGGQQDQIGQVDDVGNPLEFNGKWGSNHDGKFKNHGVWVKPIWPAVRTLQGSPLTPYIFDDLIKWEDIAEAMMFWYQIPREKRLKAGLKGREWATSNGLTNVGMCEQMQRSIDATLTNWKPRSRFSLHKPDEFVGNKMFDPNCMGFEIPKISNDSVQFDIRNFEVKLEK